MQPDQLRKVVEAFNKIKIFHKDGDVKPIKKQEPPPIIKKQNSHIYRPIINGKIYIESWSLEFGDINVHVTSKSGDMKCVFTIPQSTKLPMTVMIDGEEIDVVKEY